MPEDTYTPMVQDQAARWALGLAFEALQDYANDGEYLDLKAAEEFLAGASGMIREEEGWA